MVRFGLVQRGRAPNVQRFLLEASARRRFARPACAEALFNASACLRIRLRSPCRLTPRSRRGPTASHQARPAGLRIIRWAGLAPRRRPHLTSNVRRRLWRQCFRVRAHSVAPAAAAAHQDALLCRRAGAASWPAMARFGLVQRGRAPNAQRTFLEASACRRFAWPAVAAALLNASARLNLPLRPPCHGSP